MRPQPPGCPSLLPRHKIKDTHTHTDFPSLVTGWDPNQDGLMCRNEAPDPHEPEKDTNTHTHTRYNPSPESVAVPKGGKKKDRKKRVLGWEGSQHPLQTHTHTHTIIKRWAAAPRQAESPTKEMTQPLYGRRMLRTTGTWSGAVVVGGTGEGSSKQGRGGQRGSSAFLHDYLWKLGRPQGKQPSHPRGISHDLVLSTGVIDGPCLTACLMRHLLSPRAGAPPARLASNMR